MEKLPCFISKIPEIVPKLFVFQRAIYLCSLLNEGVYVLCIVAADRLQINF